MLSEKDFQTQCDAAMTDLYKRLVALSDEYDFDVDQNAGTLTVEFEEPRAKFVVSPNSPVKQIWVSALTRSFKLDWDATRGEFVFPGEELSLKELMADVIGKQLDETVEL